MMHPIALAMQGMAIWHLLLGAAALSFVITLAATRASLEDDTYGVSALTGAEVTGGALAAALVLGGISWAMLGRTFWRPRWSVILVPGLIGTIVSGIFELMDWPVAYLLGGAAAYWLVRIQLDRASPADSANG
ncbi:MAG TPA: hypothetical protein VGR43_09925 [Dehalococcoidia bacterium]|nr:hypothetical protein [Dehalococcoidia bacterium]